MMKIVCQLISNKYIVTHRQILRDKTKPLSDSCSNVGNFLYDQMPEFWEYINALELNQEYECSRSIVSSASNSAIKYLIKYSNIEYDEYSLERIDYCIKWLDLYNEIMANMSTLAKDVNKYLPVFVRMVISRKKLPYIVCDVPYDLAKNVVPQFTFLYVSPAGKSRLTFDIDITPSILSKVRKEIYMKIEKNNYAKKQRSIMTNDLREAIKKRDNYTCCICGNSVLHEPNLLLEVDHIIPVSRGGKTEANNLQTLCWRCNRAKSNKIS